MPAPWDRQPEEPARWHNRFDVYRRIGPRRSIEKAFALCRNHEHQSGAPALTGQRPGAAWYNAAKRYRWTERAEAWDEHERERLRALEATRREDARNERIDMIDAVLIAAFDQLLPCLQIPDGANVTDLRLIFRDMLIQQRAEMPAPVLDDEAEPLEFTADDLIAAQERLEQWRAAVQARHELDRRPDGSSAES